MNNYTVLFPWRWVVFVSILVFLFGCQSDSKQADNDPPPNIIFILSDDHAYQAISAYGHKLNQTPNIDRIAREGALFTRSFVSNSICAPSRSAILTGKHSHINGKVDNFHPFDWNQNNLAKSLKRGGYQTALIGKIHLDGTPQGFDYYNVLPGQGHYYNPDFIENGVRTQHQGYVTTLTTQFALDWLKNKRASDQPFVLFYNQKAPHRMWMPEPRYFEAFETVNFEVPNNFFDDYAGRPAAAQHEMGVFKDLDLVYDLKLLDQGNTIKSPYRSFFQNNYDRMSAEQQSRWDAHYQKIISDFMIQDPKGQALALWKYNRYMRDYLSTVQSVDDGVGEVLDYLDAEGLSENTIIIYTSDQGFYLGEHGWFDKRYMYEESFRTPLLVRYPKKIKPGLVVEELVQNIDFMPTLMDYAGLSVDPDVQGMSFKPLLDQEAVQWRNALYYTYYEYPGEHNVPRHHGIRTKDYKLIHFYYDLNHWELYDLKNDPNEMNNRYDDPSYTDIRSELHQQLADLRELYKDSDAMDQYYLENTLKNQEN